MTNVDNSDTTHDERFSLTLFDLSFYFHLHFPVLFLFSFYMFPDLQTDLYDQDSVQNDLRHSAKGSFVTFDDRHSLKENVSKKARVARNVLHIWCEDSVQFDVNEEAWPNADLAIHSSYEGAFIDGLPADRVKSGDEREIKQMKVLQLCSWIKETDISPDKSILLTGWARRMKGK